MPDLVTFTPAEVAVLRRVVRQQRAGKTSQRPVARRRRNPGGAPSAPAAPVPFVGWIAVITAGTPGYLNGSAIKPAELPSPISLVAGSQGKIKMFKGKGRRFTVLNVPDPEPSNETDPDYSEPETEDADSLSWFSDFYTVSAVDFYKDDGKGGSVEDPTEIELLNWTTAPIQVLDRVFVIQVTTRKGRKRNLIVARDCGV